MGETLPDDSQPAPRDEDLCCALCGHNLGKEVRGLQACPGCGQQFAKEDGQAVIPDDRDLYCLHCGYNLRGLSGDPRRCPECFHLNPLDVLVVPAAEIKRQIRKMETAPVLCVVIGACCGFLAFLAFSGRVLAIACAFLLPLLILLWLLVAADFASSCQYKPAWRKAMAWYHVYALAAIALAGGTWWGLAELLRRLVGPVGVTGIVFAGIYLLAMGALLVLGYRPLRWLYRQGKGDFESLQRAVAAEIVRKRQRKALGQRGWRDVLRRRRQ